LAYMFYLMRDRSYDSGVLAEYVARKYRKQQPDLALDAAYLAQAAYIQAYHRETKERRGPEIAWVVNVCNYITDNWAGSDKAQDARMNLGGLYAELNQPAEAAKWYASVPESAPQFLDAQLKAGNAWWNVYVHELTRPEAERKPREQVDELLNQSRQILAGAITKFEAQVPKEAAQVEPAKLRDLSLAKLTLATILNGAGDYKGALGLLADAPLNVVASLPSFQPGSKQHVDVGVLTYIQVLRAYIGVNELAKAQAAQKELDTIVSGSGGGGKALTQVYIDFGSQLKKEVQRLQAAHDPRLADVLKSFETFLDEVAKRKDSQSYYSLRWIGETYRDLGEGLGSGDRARADVYYNKAIAAFQQILDEELKSPGFAPADQASGVQLAIVRCQRLQQAFETAEKGILKILKARPRAIDAQEEAARLYADWAARGAKGDLAKWNLAIEGDQNLKTRKPENRVVWGWFGISQRLENSLNQGGASASDELEAKYFASRYQTALVRFHWSQAEPDDAKRRTRLGTAYRDIRVTATTMPSLGGEESFQRFNTLYREIQQEMINAGKFDEVAGLSQPVDLEIKEGGGSGSLKGKKKPAKTEAAKTEVASTEPAAAAKKKKAKSAEPAPPAKTEGSGGSIVPWIVAGTLLVAAGGIVWAMLRSSSSRRRRRPVSESIEVPAPKPTRAAKPASPPAKKPNPS
ncbi:MAG: hypothetical protein NT069_05075, partial [Planctomycetota bacterium]|nr:hypothetical protein [Planctomycetota bacterium]